MKHLKLFILTASLCIYNCLWAQKPSNDGVTWSATLSYCINTDVEQCDQVENTPYNLYSIYNLTCTNKQGNLRKALDEMYKGMTTYKWPLFSTDIYNNCAPGNILSKGGVDTACIEMLELVDSMGSEIQLMKKMPANKVAGISLWQEWFFDRNTGKILTSIPDASLLKIRYTDEGEFVGMQSIGTFKFSDRCSDSGSKTQAVYNPEISWGKGMSIPLLYDSVKGISLGRAHDTTCFNGSVFSRPIPGNTVPLKVVFNKKLVDWIYDAAMKGKLISYKFAANGSAGEKMTAAELHSAITYTNVYASVDDTGMERNRTVTATYTYSDLTGLEVVQEITLNTNTLKFEAKIIRAAVLAKKVDANGNANCSYPLFWVKFE